MGNPQIWGPEAEKALIVGLTGGIASGKSEVAVELERLGARVIDADRVAREVVAPGSPVSEELIREFGSGITDSHGGIDREKLAEIVFGNEERRATLNRLTHPAIFESILRKVHEILGEIEGEKKEVIVIDAALIADLGIQNLFDLVIAVVAPKNCRVERLVLNRNMAEEEALRRINSQVDDFERIEAADLVVRNERSLENLKEEVHKAWDEIRRIAEGL